MKIRLLTYEVRDGWVGTYPTELREQLEQRGHDVETLTLGKPTLGGRDLFHFKRLKRDRLNIATYDYILPRFRPEIVIAHGTYALTKPYPFGRLLEYRAMRRCRVITCSEFTQKRLSEANIPSEVMLHPIDATRWTFRERTEGRNFVSVCRLIKRKGLDIALDALVDIEFDKYYIVGDGPEMDDLRMQAEVLGLQDKVVFVGWVDHKDLQQWYDKADIYLQPNRIEGYAFEGLGLSFMEAQACGLPCVATPNGGQMDAIGLNCGNTSNDINTAIKSVQNRVPFCSKKARAWAEKNDWETYIQNLLDKEANYPQFSL